MASYRQYCPVARGSEIIAERWSLLIVRNLMFGAESFTDIARGAPSMSRSMLVKRLRELERAGVVQSEPRANGHGSTYALTEAGRDLAGVVDAIGVWAESWVEVLPEHADPGFALWAWCRVQLDRSALPDRRVTVRFEFPDQPARDRFYWLLIADRDAELCISDPGGEPDLYVVTRSGPFVEWHRGALEWSELLRTDAITLSGDPELVTRFPSWNTRRPVMPAT